MYYVLVASTEITLKIHNEYSNVFTGVGYFRGRFSLLVKDNAKQYQMLLRHLA